jgi:nitrate/TMAO reductase-like tetraheme cytochrome c subunit
MPRRSTHGIQNSIRGQSRREQSAVTECGEPSRIALLLTCAPLASLPRALLAQGRAADFQFDPVEFWAGRILIWGVAVALAVVAYALFRAHRGRLAGPVGKLVLLTAVVVLPSFSVATGMLLVFSRAERVEFCGSCHLAMGGFVADMSDPRGEGLAAIHYRDRLIPSHQCYECHTSYGLFGNLQAKVHGVGQVIEYYAGGFEPPATMWQPYSNADCLKCHARSQRWLREEAHTDEQMKRELFEDRVSCMNCHEPGHLIPAMHGGETP